MPTEDHDPYDEGDDDDAGPPPAGLPAAWPVELTAAAFARAMQPLERPDADPADVARHAAEHAAVAAELTRQFAPRDAAEQLLVAQMIWTHARVSYLTRASASQRHPTWFTAYATELTRASHLYRRQLLALAEYRRPRRRGRAGRKTTITTIRTAHIAAQQLIATTGGPLDVAAVPADASPQADVPPDRRRLRRPAPGRPGPPLLDGQHRPPHP